VDPVIKVSGYATTRATRRPHDYPPQPTGGHARHQLATRSLLTSKSRQRSSEVKINT
jgi:hypothetical protein